VNLSGTLNEGTTATDLVLRITELLRKANVVGKFVEFFGEGAAALSATDRATIANMAPEYGATMGFFGTDEKTLEYLAATGRSEEHIGTIRNYYSAQEMFGIPGEGEIDYTQVIDLDLSSINPSVAGPKRPQDRIDLSNLDNKFKELFSLSVADGGYGKTAEELEKRFPVTLAGVGAQYVSGGGNQNAKSIPLPILGDVSAKDTNVTTEVEMINNRPTPDRVEKDEEPGPRESTNIGHGDVVIAAITSCTNTSNPSVMIAAGIVAKKAAERGMKVPSYVKTSLAPGSRVVSDYLEKAGLQKYLDEVGFNLVGYGCTTCIGNSGPLDAAIEEEIVENDIIAASVLSGNRNFEARVHQNVKANFLMSPPLVVAYALAGTVLEDVYLQPLGKDTDGNDVFLKDLWPSLDEVREVLQSSTDPETYKRLYSEFAEQNPLWNGIESPTGKIYEWDKDSTYIQEPPYFDSFSMEGGSIDDIKGARPLAIFGDSVTTDHISPAGAIKANSPAGLYLQENGVAAQDFNSYGSRRGNDRVMLRGTFANVRIKNQMVTPVEGGMTRFQPDGEEMTIYDAAMRYKAAGTPLVIFAGKEYGTGSSRDWAAKGTRLMGVKAVVAESFERIHRSNLVGMGVLPFQFKQGTTAATLGLTGTETFSITGLAGRDVRPMQDAMLEIVREDGTSESVPVILRIDTPIEVEYYKAGGILPFVLRQIINGSEAKLAA
jgi:aconitate hydratase